MKKLAILTGVVAFAVTFGFGVAVKIAQASHSETFCAAHPIHPHCPPTGGGTLTGDIISPFVANGTCNFGNGTCIGAKVGDACSDDADCKGEVDGSARLNSLGLWRVDTTGLTPSENFDPNPDSGPGNHDICLEYKRLNGFNGVLVLNRDTQTTSDGDFLHSGNIDPEGLNSDPEKDLSGNVVAIFIKIIHDPLHNSSCTFVGENGSVAQITGLTLP